MLGKIVVRSRRLYGVLTFRGPAVPGDKSVASSHRHDLNSGSSPQIEDEIDPLVLTWHHLGSSVAAIRSLPSSTIFPALGSFSRDKHRTSVDLPDPDRPLMRSSLKPPQACGPIIQRPFSFVARRMFQADNDASFLSRAKRSSHA